MKLFSEIISEMTHVGDRYHVDIPESWMQGRTTYGGLTTALCLAAIQKKFDDLPEIRTVQVCFAGPTGGDVTLLPTLMRQSKNSVYVSVDVMNHDDVAARAMFCFGRKRDTGITFSSLESIEVKAPEECEVYIPDGFGPKFVQNFEQKLLRGARPMEGANVHDHFIWVKHRDSRALGDAALLAIADMPPPAVLGMMTTLPPISSINWSINFLDEARHSPNDWWLVRSTAEHADAGYSSQNMFVYDEQGKPVIVARQQVAVF